MNDSVAFYSIPQEKWALYQAYPEKQAKRPDWTPPWIKLWVRSTDDYKFSLLTLSERGLLMEMWKLAARLHNVIPSDPRWIARAIQTEEKIEKHLKTLQTAGFLLSSNCRTDVLLDVEERRGDKKDHDAASAADVQRIFDHWKAARGKTRATLTENRRSKIKARLRDFSADELTRCIDGVALDPWEDRPRHDDLTVVLRNSEQVEKFLSFHDQPGGKKAWNAEAWIRNVGYSLADYEIADELGRHHIEGPAKQKLLELARSLGGPG